MTTASYNVASQPAVKRPTDGRPWAEFFDALLVNHSSDTSVAQRWQMSGLADLTRSASGGSTVVAGPFLDRIDAAAQLIGDSRSNIDGVNLLAERGHFQGVRGRLPTATAAQSVGGSAWILPVSDGHFVLNLARREDVASLPALVEQPVRPRNWPEVLDAFAGSGVERLDAQAHLLGFPGGRVNSGDIDEQILHRHGDGPVLPIVVRDFGTSEPRGRPIVVDLTSLWAGPLSSALIGDAFGAEVIKVESLARPDGARFGHGRFFDRLNAGKKSVALDFSVASDVAVLRALLDAADVVVEGMRPRVFDRLGIDPDDIVSANGSLWLSITAFGRTGPWANRVGFGDDVAAVAGVISRETNASSEPVVGFIGDAIADPVGGIYAAAAISYALRAKRSAVVDLALRESVAYAWAESRLRRRSSCAANVAVADPFVASPGWDGSKAADIGADNDEIGHWLGESR